MSDQPIPREALLSLPEVMRLTTLRQSAIYARMNAGTFPASRQVGPRKQAWLAAEVFDWKNQPALGGPTQPLPALMSQADILNAARDHHAIGVYFLIESGEVVYVGRSRNVFSRVAEHRLTKAFDAWHYVLCDAALVAALEAAYIAKLQPRLNVVGIKPDLSHA